MEILAKEACFQDLPCRCSKPVRNVHLPSGLGSSGERQMRASDICKTLRITGLTELRRRATSRRRLDPHASLN